MSLPTEPSAASDRTRMEEATFACVLDRHVREIPDRLAVRFLDSEGNEAASVTFAGLQQQAAAIARGLASAGVCSGPVLVTHPPGIAFIAALLGCWQAGAIAVPCYPPQGRRHRERLAAVMADCQATAVLGDESHRGFFEASGLRLILPSPDATEFESLAAPGVCLLQYTSGSTSRPKGVRITHANLLHQTRETRCGLAPLGLQSILSWLPPYHDMGLVLKILQALESGLTLTVMTPESFIQAPLRWLHAISRYRAEFSGGPNFAFDLCVRSAASSPESLAELDLSCWKAVPCGAERIRPETLDRFAEAFADHGFRKDAFLPGYGLAESTLIVTAKRPGVPLREVDGVVSCGPPLTGMEVSVSGDGEILVKGPSLADGYRDEPLSLDDEGWLRTGDLGFLRDGELFVTGRVKDLLILDGRNYSPEDLEAAAALHSCGLAAAAFAVEANGREEAVLIQEAGSADEDAYSELCRRLRFEIRESTEVGVSRVVLVRQGVLPRTTSGKIRRGAARDALLSGTLKCLYDDLAETVPGAFAGMEEAVPAFALLAEAIQEATGKPAPEPSSDPARFGLGSIDVSRIAAILKERGGIELVVGDFYATRSFRELAEGIARKNPEASSAVVPPRPSDTPPLLSHSQERMWFLHQLDPTSAAYHVFGALEMTGPLDTEALQQAYASVLQRHEILRSRHGNKDGRPVVRIEPAGPRLAVAKIAAAELDDYLKSFAKQPFDLAIESPVRALLLAMGPDRQVLAICAHHIVSDGWSIRLLLKELFDGYSGRPATESASYLDYAWWHRRWVDTGTVDDQVDYWKARLTGAESGTPLPADFPRPPRPSSDGDAVGAKLPEKILTQLTGLAQERRATPFTVLLAAFQVLLHRHGCGAAPVIAVPVANRHHPGSGDLIGTLVNTLPFRLAIDPGEDFATLVDRVRDANFAMLAAQDAPFEKIIEAVQPERTLDRAPLAQIMFDHQEIPYATEWPGGLSCQPLFAHRGAAQFDLSLLIFALPTGNEVFLEYRTDLFARPTAEALLDRYLTLIEELLEAPDEALSKRAALTVSDRQFFDRVSEGPQIPGFLGVTPVEEILAQTQRTQESTAVICGDISLTYDELIHSAQQVAALLRREGLVPGDRVGVMLPRDIHLIPALLGIWLAGAAYVPLDPANPAERLAWILEDQQPLKILTTAEFRERLPEDAGIVLFDGTADLPPTGEDFPIPGSEQAAYILYTSGSTGRPKGVMVSHGALGNFLLSMQERPGITSADRVAAITTLSFDISALELFLPLITGAAVDLIPASVSRDGIALRDHLRKQPATILQATPATWRMLLDAGWDGSPGLKILCGGEALDLPLASALVTRGAEVWNLYGPTETTVWSTLWKVPQQPQRILIGQPIANTCLAIVSPDGLPVPPGVTGELLIGGGGVAEGYWKNPELTDARFITHERRRFYRTGDLARWTGEGELECLGRIDSQVKIRGHRIELGEVEAALAAHPEIIEAAAAVDGSAGDARLNGYYRSSSPLDSTSLRSHLETLLPGYMVPSRLVEVASMPLTGSGKIDRRALLAIPTAETAAKPETAASAPQDLVTSQVAEVWQELLGCGPVGPDDDFFALGGHSLLASRMVARVSERLGLPVALDVLFQRPTLAAFAAEAGKHIDPAVPRAVLLHRGMRQDLPPVFWMHTLVDGGMGLFPYRRAAALLEGITSYGIAEGTRAFESIAEMAREHVAVIRRIQPHGPYRLTGFCFGGNLAAEVASQLAESGEEIETLALLETEPPGEARNLWRWLRPSLWRHIAMRLFENLPRIRAFGLPKIARRLRMKQRALASTLSSRRSGAIPDIEGVLDLSQLSAEERDRASRHWTALHRHSPRLPDRARIVVVTAQGDGWLPRSVSLGWERLAPGRIETRTVPGRHEEFLRGDSAAQVAAVLSELLE